MNLPSMKKQDLMNSQSMRRSLAIGLATLCAACSGGISGSGSGGVPAGSAAGPIDGFGSVIINGSRFNTDTATFIKDGVSATQSDLSVGQMIQLDGDFDSLVATSVSYRSEVKGPATSVTVTDPDLGTGTILVLGQTVHVNAATVFNGTALSDIVPGDLLEVSGPRDANDGIVASYIESKQSLAEYKVYGELYTLNTTAGTFTIDGLTVSYFGADVSDMPADTGTWLETFVEVKGDPGDFDSVASSLLASKVELVPALSFPEGARLEIEGYISYFTGGVGAAEFEILGVPVRYTADTVYINGDASSLTDNVKVKVSGVGTSDGRLGAEICEILTTNAVRTEWELGAVDTTASTVTILGIEWDVRESTELRDKSSLDLDPLLLSDLSVGDRVMVRGYMDGSTPTATRLERDDAQSDARIRGPVTSVAGVSTFRFEVLGVELLGDGLTIYRDENNVLMTQQEFFDALSLGRFVQAKWDPFSSTGFRADELSFEND